MHMHACTPIDKCGWAVSDNKGSRGHWSSTLTNVSCTKWFINVECGHSSTESRQVVARPLCGHRIEITGLLLRHNGQIIQYDSSYQLVETDLMSCLKRFEFACAWRRKLVGLSLSVNLRRRITVCHVDVNGWRQHLGFFDPTTIQFEIKGAEI